MSAERAGQPILRVLLRDVVLARGVAHLIQKPHWLLPLPVVGGGMPITRH